MQKNSTINVRVEENLKREAEEVFKDLGISTSIEINLFLPQVVHKDGIPFTVDRNKTKKINDSAELAALINLTGGKKVSRKFRKLIELYASGDIDYEVAVYAIKREFINENSL